MNGDDRLREVKRKLAGAKTVRELGLPTRAVNALERDRILIVADLLVRSEQQLLRIPDFGRAYLEVIIEALAEDGLALRREGPAPKPSAPPSLTTADRLDSIDAKLNTILVLLTTALKETDHG